MAKRKTFWKILQIVKAPGSMGLDHKCVLDIRLSNGKGKGRDQMEPQVNDNALRCDIDLGGGN